ncbi:Transcriptional regulator GlxA family, contains an amidase domain and an AraC-type DNA-binding HTH domain [Duganella sp. CF517]|uniref:GlxA family transcriptional regulator n=1 Tax=Duganella sp. CF517 TaxID=1881038 RepID=UPI0008B58DEE|nr:helix-turn-helix domain-containing protein [Duganella sp. CF517]SEO14694.1 Transcriptional regulator GlxA family, contains an amidase domain and an AraC-type DNA-binding HTH domain [Duganella sp. CF517]
MPTSDRPIRVAVIAYDGITPFHLSVPCLVFDAGQDGGFDVRVCAADGTPLRTSAGFAIATDHDLRALDDADIVIMPSWHSDCRTAPPALLAALRAAHARGARVVGLCLGAFALAEAGLLDGKSATTHWQFATALAARHPRIDVDPDVLYVDAGQVLTSAGVAAGLDCCLHLLRQLRGADAANRVARQLVIAPHRQGGQAQFIERPLPVSSSDGRFAGVLEWVTQRLAQAHSIDALAERAAMSRRNFTRHFRQATGTSFKQWLLGQRLAHAQWMLESGDASIEVVAQQAGFGSALSLRQYFRTVLQTSPSAYRGAYRR